MSDSDSEDRLAQLMRAIQEGDGRAYAHLLQEITPRLRQAIRQQRRFLQPQDIEDLVQDVLMSLHAVRATYDPGRPFMPWLLAIMRNRLADRARQYARRVAHEVNVEQLPVTFADDSAKVEGEQYGDPEALAQAIKKLPKGQREAITMLKLRQMSLKEAAAHSGTSIAALKVSVHRGVLALRKMLTKS